MNVASRVQSLGQENTILVSAEFHDKIKNNSSINAKLLGHFDPEKLAMHRNGNCKKSQEEIAKALKGNNRADFLFGLKQEYDSYLFFQKKIEACDTQINAFLKTQINSNPEKKTKDG